MFRRLVRPQRTAPLATDRRRGTTRTRLPPAQRAEPIRRTRSRGQPAQTPEVPSRRAPGPASWAGSRTALTRRQTAGTAHPVRRHRGPAQTRTPSGTPDPGRQVPRAGPYTEPDDPDTDRLGERRTRSGDTAVLPRPGHPRNPQTPDVGCRLPGPDTRASTPVARRQTPGKRRTPSRDNGVRYAASAQTAAPTRWHEPTTAGPGPAAPGHRPALTAPRSLRDRHESVARRRGPTFARPTVRPWM